MSIDLRSSRGILAAKQALELNEYDDVAELHLKFHTPFFNRNWQTPDNEVALEEMMDTAGKLPLLKALTVVPIVNILDGARNCRVPASALQKTVDRARKLKNISIQNVKLVGTSQDFEVLAESLKNHPALKSITLRCGCQEHEWNGETLSYDMIPRGDVSLLDPVVCALASISTVETIELTSGALSGGLTKQTLDQLGRQSTLKVLKIMTFPLSDVLLSTLAQGLNSSTLESLKLACDCLGEKGSKALKELVGNNSCVRDIQFYMYDFEAKSDASVLLKRVTGAIGRSNAETLTLNVTQKYTNILQQNTREMLRSNYALTSVNIRCLEKSSYIEDAEVDFLVKANKLGRGCLFQGQKGVQDKISWVTMFEATDNDLSNIFFLVRSHPYEFADMGLKDCSENMTPTMRTMKSAFIEHSRKLSKRIADEGREIRCATDEMLYEAGEHSNELLGEMKQEQEKLWVEMRTLKQEHQGDNKKFETICNLLSDLKKEQQEQSNKTMHLKATLFWYKGISTLFFVALVSIMASFKLDSF